MDVNAAVRKLREVIGDSQQAFATRLKLSIRAIVNYEKDRVPSPKALAAMAHLARKHGAFELANLFWSHLPEELQSVPVMQLPAAQAVSLDEAKVMLAMLPKPGPSISQGPVETQLTDVRTPLMECIRGLNTLISGDAPQITGTPADTIATVIRSLETIARRYGQTVRVVPTRVVSERDRRKPGKSELGE